MSLADVFLTLVPNDGDGLEVRLRLGTHEVDDPPQIGALTAADLFEGRGE